MEPMSAPCADCESWLSSFGLSRLGNPRQGRGEEGPKTKCLGFYRDEALGEVPLVDQRSVGRPHMRRTKARQLPGSLIAPTEVISLKLYRDLR